MRGDSEVLAPSQKSKRLSVVVFVVAVRKKSTEIGVELKEKAARIRS